MASSMQQHKILVVEDEPIVAKIICKMLEELGYTAETAVSGEDAIAMAANQYDLIFMDIGLPGMTGIDVAAKIRNEEALKKCVSIVAMTGYARDEVKEQCFAVGMDEVVTKPVSIQQLHQLVKHYCH